MIKVLLIVSNTGSTINKKILDDGTIVYSGFLWDIWVELKKQLEKKYTLQIFYSDKTGDGSTNYDNIVKKTSEGKYDLVIGSFYHTIYREKLINYTTPILIDTIAILHYPISSLFQKIKVILEKIFVLLLFLLVLGIILGLILSFFDKKRLIPEKGTKYIIRTILTTIAAMFGETGFLSENSSMTIVGISLVIFIMLISFIWVMFIQAEITKVLIFKNSNITANNISNSELISFKGYAASQKFKELFPNVKIKEFEFKLKKNNDQTEPLIKEYMNNSDKYQGIIISYARAYPYFKKYPQFHKRYNFVN